MTFILICHNRHFLFNNGSGLILVDTGSPASLHKDGTMVIAGQSFSVPTTHMNVGTEYISEKVGREIVGLLGMDIISRFQMAIHKVGAEGGTIEFNSIADDIPNCRHIDTFNVMGIPGIGITVDGQTVRLLFDTGAPISYIGNSLTDGKTCIGHATDFSPLTGVDSYEVDLYSLRSEFCGKAFDVSYANMPFELSLTLSMIRVDGIIGYDLLDQFKVILNGGEVWIG
jgi:hypothetical protein